MTHPKSLPHRTGRPGRKGRPAARNRSRPRLEWLEGRLAPATFVVNSAQDVAAPPADVVTLRSALLAANASPDPDTITFAPSLAGQTIILTSTLPTINQGSLDIVGPGANLLTVSGNNAFRVFDFSRLPQYPHFPPPPPPPVVAISGLTITGGSIAPSNSPGAGAGIFNDGDLTLDGVIVTGNHANGTYDLGGGIATQNRLTLIDSTVSNNSAAVGAGLWANGGVTVVRSAITANRAAPSGEGGGIDNLGQMAITDSTISDNLAVGVMDWPAPFTYGGGILSSGTLTLTRCTVSGNRTDGLGGGILNYGALTVNDSTIANNASSGTTAPRSGAGAIFLGGGSLAVNNSTITGNTDASGSGNGAGGISAPSPFTSFQLNNSVVAGNYSAGGAAPDVRGAVASGGGNFIGVGDAGLTGIADGSGGNRVGTPLAPLDPLLGPLQDNGGPTLTRAPLPGSPLIDAGVNALVPADLATDQRGLPRLVGAAVDIGAVEIQLGQAAVGAFDPATATWYLRSGASAGPPDAGEFQYGPAGSIPVTGDWSGSGGDPIGVFDPQTFTWYLRNETRAGAPDAGQFQFGGAGWLPMAGDWQGSGHSGVGAFDPQTATWYLRNEPDAGAPDAGVFRFGVAGGVPVVGDWAGTGHLGIGVFDPSTFTWYLRNELSAGAPDAGVFQYGGIGFKAVAGDWSGTGHAGVGVIDPVTGTWYLRSEPNAGAPDAGQFAYGGAGWLPVTGAFAAPQFLLAAGGEGAGAAALTDAELQAAVAAALARLSTAGVDPALVAALASARYDVGALPPGVLGRADAAARQVTISADAAGRGWFVDGTPLQDEEFAPAGPGSPLAALPGPAAAGKEDLLTAVLHEMGHLAGNADGGTGLMDGALAPGMRDLGVLDQVFSQGLP